MVKSLDYETQKVHNIRIRAAFTEGTQTDCIVEIKVTDVNDNAPEIHSRPSSVTITPNLPKDSIVSQIVVDDKDTFQSFSYSIIGGNTREIFGVDGNGVVKTTKCMLESDVGVYVKLRVGVNDGVNQIQESTIAVDIRSIGDRSYTGVCGMDCADNFGYPLQYAFDESLYVVTVPENTSLGELANLTIKDSFKNVSYKIVGDSDKFQMKNGILFLHSNLDYENTSNYYLKVQASISSLSVAKVTEVDVLVVVTDIDDTPPVVVNTPNRLLVSESSVVGQYIGFIKVYDPDTPQDKLEYNINGTTPFRITPDGGLVVNNNLIGYSGKLIAVTYQVSDGHHHFTDTLYTQIHKHTYTAYLEENATVGYSIVTLEGVNQNLSYNLQNTFGIFAINSTTGVITLSGAVDYETVKRYDVVVSAKYKDGLTRSIALIKITVLNVDDNLPLFGTISPVSVLEFTSIGTEVLKVSATDADGNEQLTYSISGGSSTFAIDEESGSITLLSSLYLSSTNTYSLAIKATDIFGMVTETTVIFNVDRISSNLLGCISFSGIGGHSHIVNISESWKVGEVIGTVSANTGAIASAINLTLDANSQSLFQISPDGKISLIKALDYESSRSHIMLITATDTYRNTTGTSALFVNVEDVNEYTPILSATPLSVSGSSNVGTYVGRAFASDDDSSSQLTYSIKRGNDDRKFKINPETGVIMVNGVLDALTNGIYTFEVCVNDSAYDACKNITVTLENVDDEAPRFNHPELKANLISDSLKGTFVLSANATDDNRNKLIYSIEHQNDVIISKFFVINTTSGVVTLNAPSPAPQMYVFLVCAYDGKYKTCGTATVNVADRVGIPTFQIPSYSASVKTNTISGTTLLLVYASHNKSVLEYNIESGKTNTFRIGKYDGYITVNNADRLKGGKLYKLNVSATDQVSRQKGYTQVLIVCVKEETRGRSYIKHVNGTRMTVEYSLEPFDQTEVGYYMLIGQQYEAGMNEKNNILEPVSWYYVNHYSEYRHRWYYVAKVYQSEINEVKTAKRVKRDVSISMGHRHENITPIFYSVQEPD